MFILNSFLGIEVDFTQDYLKIGKVTVTKSHIDMFISKIIRLVLIALLMYIFIKLGTKIIDKFIKKQSKMKISLDDKKANTLGTLLKSILRYSVYFCGITAIFTQTFGTISLTFASIEGG